MACVKYIWPVLHFETLMENVLWGNLRYYNAHIRALIKAPPRLWQRAPQVLKHKAALKQWGAPRAKGVLVVWGGTALQSKALVATVT